MKMARNMCVWLFASSLILLVLNIEARHPTTPRHTIVRPVVLHGRTRRELSTTRHKGNIHHPEVVVALDVKGEKYILELELNHGLLPEGHSIRYQEGGRTVLYRPRKEEIELCQYTGHIRGKPESRVALSTCQGLRGVIHDGDRITYIEPTEGGTTLQSLHYAYDHVEAEEGHRCGTEQQDLEEAELQLAQVGSPKIRHKRSLSSMHPVLRAPDNSNDSSLYVELVLVADHAQFLAAGKDLDVLYSRITATTNILNAIYATLNIFIALKGIDVWTTENRIELDSSSGETLARFNAYRKEHLLHSFKQHDHALLITSKYFDNGIVGLAYRPAICSPSWSSSLIYKNSQEVSVADLTRDAKLMAHEIGHSFGMAHDDATCKCPAKYCFQSSAGKATHWSDCNKNMLKSRALKGQYECLRQKPEMLFGLPSCGNGFLEAGEACDCGVTVEGVPATSCHLCCDRNTCQLLSNEFCRSQ